MSALGKTNIIIRDNEFLKIIVSKQYYEREAVFAAAKKFTDQSTIIIRPTPDEKQVEIVFQTEKENDVVMENIAKSFCNELLDQQTRLDLEKRFWKIRNLIVQHAFLPIENLTEETLSCK